MTKEDAFSAMIDISLVPVVYPDMLDIVEFAELAEHAAYSPGTDGDSFWACATTFVLAIVFASCGWSLHVDERPAN